MNANTNIKLKQILLNILLILLAFTVQNCVFPLLPFLAATPNLLLILTFFLWVLFREKSPGWSSAFCPAC